ncbi:thioredoxin peroxidase dot5 [Savitreella phatthalungensis]
MAKSTSTKRKSDLPPTEGSRKSTRLSSSSTTTTTTTKPTPSSSSSPSSSPSSKKISVGDALPEFALRDQSDTVQSGATLFSHISDTKVVGGVVLFSYPAASTPGCTSQACSYRDGLGEASFLRGLEGKWKVVGISTDTVTAQNKFREKQKLGYTLLSDPKGDGLLKRLGAVGGGKKSATRSHWVVVGRRKEEGGELETEFIDVSVGTKPKDCLANATEAVKAYEKRQGEKKES